MTATAMKLWKKIVIAIACLTVFAAADIVVTPNAGQASAATLTDSQKADKIVALAKSLKGKVKYKFNVNNPSKLIFDCSSFTKYVFGKYGVSLKWGTKYQKNAGTYVAKKNLKKGDLIFFSSPSGTSKKITHVGIYMGDGLFIHDTIGSNFNGIAINKLSDYTKRYVTARRVI
ncbi:C40 family peptidase [Cohnella lubricantis]|uniref:C40 family peptidase n=1 Tax=Cohnella lubricantis TaxID=2163172 RepID=A0A841T4S5_9BACL|nr:C40 family peptidase [Cohnella lubricantis]MBB6676334.1 C40 family peptidase [Cohnella lubricantis]MBP2120297.1 cell wall-associated NlpC family hydrolase [Cohnella lubricantis]